MLHIYQEFMQPYFQRCKFNENYIPTFVRVIETQVQEINKILCVLPDIATETMGLIYRENFQNKVDVKLVYNEYTVLRYEIAKISTDELRPFVNSYHTL